MKTDYSEIMSCIDREPTWWDWNGTPRYWEFTPRMCPNIYASEVVLLRIACQSCGMEFDVEMHTGPFSEARQHPREWHYGDPPIHGCGCVGNTMNCEDLAVLEVWYRPSYGDFERHSELEGVRKC